MTAANIVRSEKEFPRHESVNHSIGEYVRGNVHSNTVESYFATLKRGVTGTYHSVSEAHLKRYLAEFDFRYNERSSLGVGDGERATKALKGIVGKRVSPTGQLTKPLTKKQKARAFLRWRSRSKLAWLLGQISFETKPKRVRIGVQGDSSRLAPLMHRESVGAYATHRITY
jgi:hypothetical protein